MTPERWRQISGVFKLAAERQAEERADFLAEACAGDAALRREVEQLLRSLGEAAGAGSIADALKDDAACAPPAGRDALAPGERIGHYEVVRKLGGGGMGEVYLAEDVRPEHRRRRVALKLLRLGLARDAGLLRRFAQEARAALALNHPHVMTIYEIGEDAGRRFIATEFIEGETLTERMARAPMSLAEMAGVAAQAASALAAAHEAGVVHRDIKPDNIMLRRDGYVKVLDFGIAKLTQGDPTRDDDSSAESPRTTPGLLVGTVSYMSPEQARGLEVDARTDVWSLGVVLYRMAAGRLPFDGGTPTDTLALILQAEPPPLEAHAPDAPEELRRVISKALSKRREERYQSIAEMLADLQELKQELEFRARLRALARTGSEEGAASEGAGREKGGRRRDATSSGPSTLIIPRPNNLPAHLPPLVGRDAEVGRIKETLQRDDVHLLTLTGAGGTGKTRLGLEAAARLLGEFDDGAFFVALAPVGDQALVAQTIAQTLGVRAAPGGPVSEGLKQHLRNRRLLLVLDNFEHLLGAAPLVAELLAACPRLKVLVTSRAVLRLRGEQEFVLSPLGTPDLNRLPPLEALAGYPSVKLFTQRVREVNPDFVLAEENARAVAEVCNRLDGLPLAIELAAARIKVLSPQAMSARLQNRLKLLTGGARDLPARQQTMRATIEWSHGLLGDEEKALFRRLSVFAGGCDLEAAESVCDAAGDLGGDVVGHLASLVDKSLLRHEERAGGEPRFAFLETIREYGSECLLASGEGAEVRRRHAAFFLGLAERAAAELLGPNQEAWLDALELEHDNLRAAIEWAVEGGELETGLRLGGALWRFWWVRGYLAEGRARLDRLLALAGRPQDRTKPYLKILYAAGILADAQGDYAAARRLFEANLAINRESQDRAGIANSLNNLGIVAMRGGDYAAARALYKESLAVWRELGQKRAAALCLDNLGNLACAEGDLAAARSLYQESLSIFRELDDQRGVASSLNHLADLARKARDDDAARSLYKESLALFLKLGSKSDVARALTDLGDLAREQGDYAAARHLYQEGMVIFGELGDLRGITCLLEGFMSLAAAQAQPGRALRLARAAAALRERHDIPLPPAEQARFEQRLTTVRQALSEGEAVRTDAPAMSVEQAIEYALSV
jgi:predicted ATPase/serine/threonine protein kinase